MKQNLRDCIDCEIDAFTRNYYFTGKLLVERDFTDEQRYVVERFRHHAQRLHGTGVVCGLEVHQHTVADCRGTMLRITAGSAIDCCGHEILVPREEIIRLTDYEAFHEIYHAEQAEGEEAAAYKLQICLKYHECPTEDVPVLYDDCGYDDNRCAPNRILESYRFDVLVEVQAPEDSEEPEDCPPEEDTNCFEELRLKRHSCAGCESGDCLVLATIENYHAGDMLLDMNSDTSDDDDFAFINNGRGRKVLLGVQELSELLFCLIEQISKQYPKNIYPRISEINWTHQRTYKLGLEIDEASLANMKQGLVVTFDRDVLAETLTEHSFEVSIRQDTNLAGAFSYYQYLGIQGTVRGLDSNDSLAERGAVRAAVFTPVPETFEGIEWPPGTYRVILRGNHILGSDTACDANGNKFHPAVDASFFTQFTDAEEQGSESVLDGRFPTGDKLEGGTFFSWFTITRDEKKTKEKKA